MIALLSALLLVPAQAASPSDAAAAPVLAELFTSQSCSSCPPAQDFFAELADDPDVVALEWHVTYWDDLVHGRHGAWKDPYSDKAYTQRQRDYNAVLRGTRASYTPQAIVAGQAETVGARRRTIRNLIDTASVTATLDVEPRRTGYLVRASTETPAELWVAVFDREVTTNVERGENHGRTLPSRNVVVSHAKLADVDGAAQAPLPAVRAGQGCAVWLQAPNQGAVFAARYCEAP